MRWVLLDEVIEIKKGVQVRAKSRVLETEASPEVLLLEMMAQAGGMLLGAENDYKDDVVFAKIETASYPIKTVPGEGFEVRAFSDNLRPEGSWIEAEISNTRGILAKAKFMLVNAGTLVPGKTTSTTFHEAFMKHYKVREKIV